MEKFTCNYCNSTFTYKHNLLTHQKTAKKCLAIQHKDIKSITCDYCNKDFTSKQNLLKHKCINELQTLKNELELKDEQLREAQEKLQLNEKTLRNELELKDEKLREAQEKLQLKDAELQKEIKFLNLTINEHKTQIEFLKEQLTKSQEQLNKIAEIGAKKHTNNNTTYKINQKILNQLVPYDITKEKIDRIVEEKFTDGHLIQGKSGIINIAEKNILKDEQGNKKLICTDVSRRIFIGKDEKGNKFKDPDCLNFISNYIPSIEKKSFKIINEYEDNDDADKELIDELRQKAIDIILH